MEYKIPLYKTYWDEDDIKAINESIRRGVQWAEGPNTELFERKIIEYIGTSGALVCNSGTSALHLAVMACGIKHFHEVIVPSFTFIATANCVRFVGAKPVFADIEEETLGLDPIDVERKITNKTKAIIAVHYAGLPCKIRELRGLAKRYNLILIEDVAEAMGADTDGLKVGRYGDCAILSFCANKIISTGEGGALVTDNKYIYDRAKLLRSHGKDTKHDSIGQESYTTLGYNFRMSDMTAALGVSQIEKIEKLIEARQKIARWYNERLSDIGDIQLPNIPRHYRHVYQLYSIRIKNGKRDAVKKYLSDNGVASKVYFYPVHQTEYYRKGMWSPIELPVTERVSPEILSLPIYPNLTEDAVDFVCSNVRRVLC